MDFKDFLKTTGAGGEQLARQAWHTAIGLAKEAAPASAEQIDAAFQPDPAPVDKAAGDGATASEGEA